MKFVVSLSCPPQQPPLLNHPPPSTPSVTPPPTATTHLGLQLSEAVDLFHGDIHQLCQQRLGLGLLDELALQQLLSGGPLRGVFHQAELTH